MRPSWPAPMMPIFMSARARGPAAAGRGRLRSVPRGTGPEPCVRCRTCSREWQRRADAALVAPAAPMASVPTGMPAGICTIESSESMPLSAFDCTGTPSTGSEVFAAVMPGRCAAPPAPAMMTSSPRPRAVPAYSNSRSGVRCAETTRVSNGTPRRCRVSAAGCIVSQSDFEPMMMPTSGFMRRL